MRAIALVAALVAATAAFALPPTAPAQQPRTSTSAAAELPSRPIPYTQLVRRKGTAVAPRAGAARRRSNLARAAAAPVLTSPPVPERPGARLAPSAAIPPAELEAFVDGTVAQAKASARLPGAAVVIVQDGQVVLERGYGTAAASQAVDPRATLFPLGTTSESLTWIAVLKAVEEGRLRLDQPVNALLPAPLRVRDAGFREPVRVRDLLAHTSGFEAREAGRLFTPDPRKLKSLSETLRRDPPRRVRPPGQPSTWSTADATVAGAVLEAVYRQPFADLMQGQVLTPLGLSHTSFRQPAPTQAMAVGSSGWGHAVGPTFSGGFVPASGAVASADDMGRLMRAWLGAGVGDASPGWGPGVAAALRTPMTQAAGGLNGWPGGWVQSALPGGFSGYGRGGSAPGFRTRLIVVPDLRLGVFVAANADSAGGLADGLAPNLVARFYAAPPTPGTPAARADGLAGDYLSSRRSHHGLEKFVDHLRRIARVRALADGRLLLADADGKRLLRPSPGGGFTEQATGAPVVFAVRRGRAASFTPAENTQTYARLGVIYAPRTLAGATLAALALSLGVLAGGLTRIGRDARRTTAQSLAETLQALSAVGWLAAAAAFLAWARRGDEALLHWPGGWLVTASTLALAATAFAMLALIWLPQVWRGDRRGSGWSSGRKLAHTVVTLAFVVYAVLLGVWGALAPWSA